LIAPFLQVKAGMSVIDACAGAGGKALHLATLMHNLGALIAMDTEGHKLEELRKRAQRNGIHIIETRTIDSPKVIMRFHNMADRLLLDVPCSGLGVLRRNPDTKWKLKPEFLDSIRATQAEIIQNYSKMVKIGGKMVYATCSILPSENQNQVAAFLNNNKNWQLEEDKTVTAHADGFDGFYMARLARLF
jgi:16S rRNA (cytosine967-C5)-methyltransferase